MQPPSKDRISQTTKTTDHSVLCNKMAGVLENRSGHSSADSSAGDLADADKNGAVVLFNEQTNYVPRRTIITVGGCRIGLKLLAR
jgi:hypothetical protein